ncbi:glycosyltransferase family 4 protein [Flavobacterium fluviatile]|uniref:glycosyltransferase family 4 protein n=1 Tax=Flavobacterium fluviatile TaxID=1862387 RepID=UPI0013D4E3CC|nr:glycosyltransferase family 4 protein [Flavobacterium fluviatile]
MKILNITTIREWRGGDNQMYTIFKLLQEKKDLKQFILCPENSVLAEKCKTEGIACYTYDRTMFKLVHATQKIIQICKTDKIDIIHVHDSSALNAALLSLLFLPKSIQILLSRKRNNPIKEKFLNKFKYSHPRIIKIISVSKAVEAIFNNIIADKQKLVTIYDAIDVNNFTGKNNKNLLHKEYNLNANTKIIGNIAGLTEQKDIFTFIDTAKKIIENKPDDLSAAFFVIGDGNLKSELLEYIKLQKLENFIFFTGFRNDVAELLPEFDVLLMTSVSEGLPLTIYEAFASKIPVVTTNAGGIAEVVIEGKTGFITNLRDSVSLSEKVLYILKNKEIAEKITLNAFEIVKKNHDLEVMKENYYKFYKTLAK